MTCGNTQLPPKDYEEQRLSRRMDVEKEDRKPSLRERLGTSNSQVGVNATSRGRVPSQSDRKMKTPGRDWTSEERRELKTLIEKRGTTAGIKEFIVKHPERTEQGCAYQWHNAIKKGRI